MPQAHLDKGLSWQASPWKDMDYPLARLEVKGASKGVGAELNERNLFPG